MYEAYKLLESDTDELDIVQPPEVEKTITAYRASPIQNFDYETIPEKMELGINCGTKETAIAKSKNGINIYFDKLKFIPKNILESEDAGNFDQLHTPSYLKLPETQQHELLTILKPLKFMGGNLSKAIREYLVKRGYDCVEYTNTIESPGDKSYIILKPDIIIEVENNTKDIESSTEDKN